MYSLALLNIGLTLVIYIALTAAATVVFNCANIPRTIVTCIPITLCWSTLLLETCNNMVRMQ